MKQSVSEKYGKYLFKCLLGSHEYFFVWGYVLENRDDFLLMDESNSKLLFFFNFIDLKNFILNNHETNDLLKWVNKYEYNEDEIKIVDLNFYNDLKGLERSVKKNYVIWSKISLLLELFSDIKYITNSEISDDMNEVIENIRDKYNNNFIWKNVEKLDLIIDKKELETIEFISKYIEKSTLIVSF